MTFDYDAGLQHAHLSRPNSGLPEFGILSWPKSDKSDFGWERSDRALARDPGEGFLFT